MKRWTLLLLALLAACGEGVPLQDGNGRPSRSMSRSAATDAAAKQQLLATVASAADSYAASIVPETVTVTDTVTLPVPVPVPVPPPPAPVPPPPAPVPPPPAPAPVAGAAGPNAPSGFTAVTSRGLNSIATTATDAVGAEGWIANAEYADRGIKIVPDATAPVSPSNVLEIPYPAGMVGGVGMGGIAVALPSKPVSVYSSVSLKLSSNFFGHTSGVNKLNFYYMAGGQPSAYFSAQGQGTGALKPQIRLQGIAEVPTSRNLLANLVPGATLTRGVWHRVEVLLVANTPGQKNGEAHMWLNGVKILQHSGISYLAVGEAAFDKVSITSIWGGTSGTVPATQYVWWDHVYVSGR